MMNIPEFLTGKNIFITGGSGFVGKPLIEKLLRCCPDIGTVYLLLRPKRGKSPQERIKQITDNPLFDLLREQNPSCFDKIKAVSGDVTQLGLGLSKEDETLLASKINIIYHCAADVNFDKPLKHALLTNLRGGREVVNLALKCVDLKILLHVSTMYSNCDQSIIDEKIYSPDIDWRDVIKLAEDETMTNTLEVMTLKFIHPFPNAYTFSKKLTEQMFVDLCKDKIPLVICRPSVVVYMLREPLPAWTDNLNGPFSLSVAGAKGIIGIVYGNPDTLIDKVFVDHVIKTMIMASWRKCMDKDNTQHVTIYNTCSDALWKLRYYMDIKYTVLSEIPMENRFGWGGDSEMTSNWYYYYFKLILFNVIPALFGDLLLKLSGKKTMLYKFQKKIFIANTFFLLYFMKRSFTFKNEGYVTLENKIMDCDKKDFAFQEYCPKDCSADKHKWGALGLLAAKRFVLKEKFPIAPETFANTKKFYIFHLVTKCLQYFIVCYFLFWKWSLHLKVYNSTNNYIRSL